MAGKVTGGQYTNPRENDEKREMRAAAIVCCLHYSTGRGEGSEAANGSAVD